MPAALKHRHVASHLEVPNGNADATIATSDVDDFGLLESSSKDHSDLDYLNSPQHLCIAKLKTRRGLLCLMLLYVVCPTLLHIPKALFIWASHGFVLEFLLGAGIHDLVGSMVQDPHKLMATDVETPLFAYKDILLEEYEEYLKSHEVPIIADLDPTEEGLLDTKAEWKTLFLKSMNRYTCAAPHFPRTLEAVRNSGLTGYSIMFSRLAPGQTIAPHTGFSKMIHVYHLALKVPHTPDNKSQQPWIKVRECDDDMDVEDQQTAHVNCREETYSWKEGKEFIFDDSFTHWVENPSDEERVVFFMHIKRIDFKGWREELIASILVYVFSCVPFDSVVKVVEGMKEMCATPTTK